MRISDWSSDVCSSDLHKRVNGILFHGLSLLQRLHEGFEGVAHRRRNAGRPAIATQRGDLDDETRKLLAGAQAVADRLATVPVKSIAVLPLANASGDQDQVYFSDGLSEDLINRSEEPTSELQSLMR